MVCFLRYVRAKNPFTKPTIPTVKKRPSHLLFL